MAFAFFVSVYLGLMLVQCSRLPLWMDELFTYYTATQPTVGDLFNSIMEGCDGQPPLYTLLARLFLQLFGNVSLALRLPALLGIGVMCVALFGFCRRRLHGTEAMLAVLIACHASFYFVTEGRCYGAVLGCTALALLFWQRAVEGRSRGKALAGLSLSLAGSIAFHYYSVFLLIPFGIGECVRWARSRKADLPVWIAIGISPLILLPHLPLIRAARPLLAHNWAKASPKQAVLSYLEYLGPLTPCCIAVLVVYASWVIIRRRRPDGKTYPGLAPHEWMTCSLLALLPALIVTTALATTRVFTSRYGLPAVVGVSIVVGVSLSQLARGRRFVTDAATLILAIGLALRVAASISGPVSLRESQAALDVLRIAQADPRPVLVADDHVFMELWFYRPELRNRIVHTVAPELARQYAGCDTTPIILTALRRRVPMRLIDYSDFIESNPAFLVASDGHDWLLAPLAKSGYCAETLAPGLLAVDTSGSGNGQGCGKVPMPLWWRAR
jgi:uncharacterized membrane protein